MIVIVVKCRKSFAIFIKYGMKTVFSGNERGNSDVFRFPLPCILDPLPHPSVKPQRNQRTLHRRHFARPEEDEMQGPLFGTGEGAKHWFNVDCEGISTFLFAQFVIHLALLTSQARSSFPLHPSL